jgi:hypothetical protein
MKISTAEPGRERIAVMGAQRMAHIMGIGERGRRKQRDTPQTADQRLTDGWQC